MKRLLVYILILCFVASCFAACSADKIEVGEQSDLPHEVPYVLTFDSFDKIAELREIVNKGNDEIENYLDINGFSMNGLTCREDINNLFDQIGNLNMLHIDDASMYNLVEISYYASYGYVMSTYSNDSDTVRFICYINGGKVSADTNNVDTNSAVTERLTIFGNVVSLFEIEDTDSPFELSGRFETPNSNITILLSNQEDMSVAVEDIGTNVVSSTLFDLIK